MKGLPIVIPNAVRDLFLLEKIRRSRSLALLGMTE